MKRLDGKDLEEMPVARGAVFAREEYGLLDEASNLMGIVLLDNFDHDYSFVVLTQKGHPERLWACIDMGVSYPDAAGAEKAMLRAMDKARSEGTIWS